MLTTGLTPSVSYCRFSYAGTWEQKNLEQKICLICLFVKTEKFSSHICYENIGRKNSRIKILTSQDNGQTELNNMLVSKRVLNKRNKEGTFTQCSKNRRKIKRKASQNLDNLQNLLIKLDNC